MLANLLKMMIARGIPPVPWTDPVLSTASYVRYDSFSHGGASASGGWFSTDGMHFYLTSASTGYIYQYDMTSAWDTSTMSYVSSKYLGSTYDSPVSIVLKPTGDVAVVIDYDSSTLLSYSLSTPWDITTLNTTPLSTEDILPTARALWVNSTGDHVYLYTLSDGYIRAYPLSTPWDVSTRTTGWVRSWGGAQLGMFVNPDEDKIFIVSNTTDTAVKINMSYTNWFYPSLVNSGDSKYVGDYATTPQGILFDSSGTKMFIIDSGAATDRIITYSI